MDDREKQKYLEEYKKEKEKGIPFFPDTLFKDAIVALIIFVILIALAYFLGAPLEERANPADTTYTPRPEWYFLFLFQLLKYFPGELEFLGVVIIPTVAILLLFLLPFLDRTHKRHFLSRKLILGAVVFSVIGIITLSVLSITEAPPPTETTNGGDQVAALYTENCSPCHGQTIAVSDDVNLHDVIAQGKHEGMPAWSGDLTSDEIDALAGFILSPGGSGLFTTQCSECHEIQDLVASDPLELKNALEQGTDYLPHKDVIAANWDTSMSKEEQITLINFLIAPDGKRLYTINCSPCHGISVAFSGNYDDMRDIISQGGLHLSMPAWQGNLSESEIDILANYVVDPSSAPSGGNLYNEYCTTCHGERIPYSKDFETAREIIAVGGAHETMPVWGSILTSDQMDALVNYTLESARGTNVEVGLKLFSTYCTSCHGDFGEGGPNPARPGDIIAPISTSEYLKTRDDFTLTSIISQGQPNFGMSPFSTSFGGPLEDDSIDAIVSFIRSWEANPPVEVPPEPAAQESLSLDTQAIYDQLCAQCHGKDGLGLIGPSLRSPEFRSKNTVQDIFNTISNGHEATSMISWSHLLNPEQIQNLVDFILSFEPAEEGVVIEPTPGISSFSKDVMPIFEAKCIPCHGSMGGWDGTSYDSTINSGNNGPVVIAGDAENSLLAKKIAGTHEEGSIMPPGGKMTNTEIQLIIDWIDAGALDN